jgi:hypothetical protein
VRLNEVVADARARYDALAAAEAEAAAADAAAYDAAAYEQQQQDPSAAAVAA